MKFNFDSATLVITLIGGVLFLIRCWKVKKAGENKQVRILYVLMAICAFSFSLGILVREFSSTRSLARIVLVIQAIISGVWLGIFLTMRILGHFKPLRKIQAESDEDSQKIDALK
jgi:hypothetical protein